MWIVITITIFNQSLIDLVIIDVEFNRKDYSLSFTTTIERKLESLSVRIDIQTKLN
jgi:hypothetical protein